jgi:hypothetical protein
MGSFIIGVSNIVIPNGKKYHRLLGWEFEDTAARLRATM